MPFWRSYFHLIWATKERLPLLTTAAFKVVERSVRESAREQDPLIHAVGMVANHVHVMVSIPPSISVGTFVGKLKGESSRLLNTAGPYAVDGSFSWQKEYGVYSISESS